MSSHYNNCKNIKYSLFNKWHDSSGDASYEHSRSGNASSSWDASYEHSRSENASSSWDTSRYPSLDNEWWLSNKKDNDLQVGSQDNDLQDNDLPDTNLEDNNLQVESQINDDTYDDTSQINVLDINNLLYLIRIEIQFENHTEAKFGMLKLYKPTEMELQSIEFETKIDSLKGKIIFSINNSNPILFDIEKLKKIIDYSNKWKIHINNIYSIDNNNLLKNVIDNIILVKLINNTYDIDDEYYSEIDNNNLFLDTDKLQINIFTDDTIIIDEDLIEEFEWDILLHKLSPYVIRSIINKWQDRKILQLSYNINMYESYMSLFGNIILKLIIAINEFLSPHSKDLISCINKKLEICKLTNLEVFNYIINNKYNQLELWRKIWDDTYVDSLNYIFNNFQNYKGETLCYTEYYITYNYTYIHYELNGWYRYYSIYNTYTKSYDLYEQEKNILINYPNISPYLELDIVWLDADKIIYDKNINAYISKKNNILPNKVIKLIGKYPIKNTTIIKQHKNKLMEYNIIKEIELFEELHVQYIENNELRKYKRCDNNIGFEWREDDELIKNIELDKINIFKKKIKNHKFFDDNKEINKENFYEKLINLNIIKNIDEIWFTLTGSNKTNILNIDDLNGRWYEIHYSEKYKSLISGKSSSGSVLLPKKVIKFLYYKDLINLVPNNIYNKCEYELLIKYNGFSSILFARYNKDDYSLMYSETDKTWILDKKLKRIEESYKIFNKSYDNTIDHKYIINEYRNIWILQPWFKPPSYIINYIKKLLDIQYIENKIKYTFSNTMIVFEAFIYRDSLLQSQNNIAIMGNIIIKYIIMKILLVENSLWTPELDDLLDVNNIHKKWLHINNINDTLDIVTCKGSLAYVGFLLGLHNHIIHDNEELKTIINTIPIIDESSITWEEFIILDSPTCLADTFCALIGGICLDNTWSKSYNLIHSIIKKFLLNKFLITQPFNLIRTTSSESNGLLCSQSCSITFCVQKSINNIDSIMKLADIKRNLEIENVNIYDYNCKLCNIKCNSLLQWNDHRNSIKHRKLTLINSSLNTLPTNTLPTNASPIIKYEKYCNICNIQCNSDITWNQHIIGRYHCIKSKL